MGNDKRKRRAAIDSTAGISSLDKAIFIILVAGLLLIPLLMRTVVVNVHGPLIQDTIWANNIELEFFNYYKFVLLIIVTIITVGLFVLKLLAEGYRLIIDRFAIVWIVLYLAVLISLLFADYKSAALYGHMYEGSLSYICYLLLFFICLNIRYDMVKLRYILYAFAVIVGINTVMGLLKYYGVDIFQFQLIKGLLTSEYVAINEGGYISSTFSNPNYASGISAVFFMSFFTMALLDDSRRRWLYLVITCLSFAFLLSALSTSGFITIVILIPAAIIPAVRIVSFKRIVATLVLLITLCSGIYYPMVAHNPDLYNETFGYIFGSIQKITSTPGVAYAAEGDPAGYEVIRSTNINDALQEVFGLPKPGVGAGSGRLYIWDKTWALIKERPFTGYGLGTLGLYFDHNDPQKIAQLYNQDTIVTKAHNYYVGLAFGMGLTGLVLFLMLVIVQAIRFVKALISNKDRIHPVHFSITMGLGAFLIQALVNDSVIGMSVIFWILSGISSGLLRQYEQSL